MMSALLADDVAVVERRTDIVQVGPCSEEALVAQAVASRRAEFRTARACARAALEALDLPTPAIGRTIAGAPIWPRGVVGSITHCEGYRAAAVALETRYAALGIDAEPDLPLPANLIHMIATPAERGALPCGPGPQWERLLFSAKEAVYKAWWPAMRSWLGFDEVRVRFDAEGGFTAELDRPLRLGASHRHRLSGRWTASGNLILTAVAIPNGQAT